MAGELGLEVVAEGVETKAQATFLREHGCGLMQGYLLSPAVPSERCIELRDERIANTRASGPGLPRENC